MKRFIILLTFVVCVGIAFADLDDNPIETTVIPERTRVNWESPQFTVDAGNNLIMAIRESDGTIVDSIQLGPVTGKDFKGRLNLQGVLIPE